MSHLYIHCGLPKTGTTSLQNFLAGARPELRALGYDYPELGTNSKGTAHHNLARELQNDPAFMPERGSTQDFLKYLETSRTNNIILSSEGFTHCLQKERKRFIEFVHKVSLKRDAFALVFTFRDFSKMAESTYLYQMTRGLLENGHGGPPSPIQVGNYLKRFFSNLEALRHTLGANHFVALDNERAGNIITGMLAFLGIPVELQSNTEKRVNERLGLKKTAFMYQTQFFPDGSPRRRWPRRVIAKIRARLSKAPELPNELYDYRIIPHGQAKAIQEAARAAMPEFLLRSLEIATEPDLPHFCDYDLANFVLPKPELEQLQDSLLERSYEVQI